MLKRIWKDPVWAGVIAAVFSAGMLAVLSYLGGFWPTFALWLKGGWEYLLVETTVPNWLVLLLTLVSLPTILVGLILLWQRLRPSTATGANWRSYTEDVFFGLRWRWRFGDDGDIYGVNTFCPHCDFQVFPQNASAWNAVDHIRFHCDSCHAELGDFQEAYGALKNKTERFIQQRIRNGSWVEAQERTKLTGSSTK